MASTLVITINSELSQTLLKQGYRLTAGEPKQQAIALSTLFRAAGGGLLSLSVDVASSASAPVAASGSIAVVYANVDADDTVTIGGVTLTAKASGANGTTEFNKQTSATVTAQNLRDCINANTTLSKHLLATAASGTVTVTALQKGSIGNLIVMSTSDATAFTLTQMASGAGGAEEAAVTYSLGI